MNDPSLPEIEQAWKLAGVGKLQDAVDLLEKISHRDRNDRILGALSHLHYRLRRYQPAELNARASLRINPKNQLALCTLGELAIQRDRREDALELFREAHHANPRNPYIVRRLASLMIHLNQPQDAVAILESIRDSHPLDRNILDMLAFGYMMLGDEPQLASVRKILSELPGTTTDTSDQLAENLRHLPVEEAQEQIKLILRIPSFLSNPKIRRSIADVMFEAKRYEDALPHLDAAIQGNPRADRMKLQQALCLSRTNRSAQALEVLDGIRHLEGTINYRVALYEVLAEVGRADEAMKGILRDLESNPRHKPLRALLTSLRKRGFRLPLVVAGEEKPDPTPDT